MVLKLNPKVAKKPEELTKLPYKKLKQLIKKELVRFEKQTSEITSTNFILLGKHTFSDKPATVGLPFYGCCLEYRIRSPMFGDLIRSTMRT